MKKTSILLVGLFFASAAFAGGYAPIKPIKLASVKVESVSAPAITVKKIPRKSRCGYYRNSRWYECDTKSVLQNRRSLISERFSDSLNPTAGNRATRGQDIEREFDRQAAARNKLLRYRRAYSR